MKHKYDRKIIKIEKINSDEQSFEVATYTNYPHTITKNDRGGTRTEGDESITCTKILYAGKSIEDVLMEIDNAIVENDDKSINLIKDLRK